jgi:tetratricopeptide (TPR) repeat protein
MDDFVRELLTLGRSCFQRKDWPRAEKYLTQVVEQSQSFADVYNMLGVIYHDQGQFARAQRAFEMALQINPGYTEAALNLAIIYNDMGMYRQAREVYQRVLAQGRAAPGQIDRAVAGKIANMHADIGDVYVSCGHPSEAVAEFERALELAPSFVDIRTRLAAALRDKGDRETALREYTRVVEEAPHYLPARVQLGVTLYGMGKTSEALAQWEEVLRRQPGHRAAEMYLALVRDAQKP